MTEDRRNLLEAMWRSCWPACRCGRCPCTRREPVATARVVFGHWARQYTTLAESCERRATGYREIASKSRKRFKAIARKYGTPIDQETLDGNDLIVRDADRSERSGRRHRHAGVLFERLSRGEQPFLPRTDPRRST